MTGSVWKLICATGALAVSCTMLAAQDAPFGEMPDMGPSEVGVVEMSLQEIPRVVTSPGGLSRLKT